MAIRNIVKDGESILRKRCREVTEFDAKLAKLLDDMRETMLYADGCGLAAPQVGIMRRAVVVEVGDFFVEMLNPRIVSKEGEQVGFEGCLSVPNKQCNIARPFKVRVEFQDRKGAHKALDCEAMIARACCHELDHLDGILFYDRELKE
ncbi:MAG: peptide deformylase [Clostridia bacterium]